MAHLSVNLVYLVKLLKQLKHTPTIMKLSLAQLNKHKVIFTPIVRPPIVLSAKLSAKGGHHCLGENLVRFIIKSL